MCSCGGGDSCGVAGCSGCGCDDDVGFGCVCERSGDVEGVIYVLKVVVMLMVTVWMVVK